MDGGASGAAAKAGLLEDMWYFALPGGRLKRGRTVAKTIFGIPMLLGRAADGSVFALKDVCPHRSMPLSPGRFDGREVECCYHGWRFDTGGVCTAIPSLVEGQKMNLDRIRVQAFPCREVQHNIWVYIGDRTDGLPEIPEMPECGQSPPKIVRTVRLESHVDDAIIGLMDPAHGPYVHKAWWWRSPKDIREKAKKFEPSPLGFTMSRHTPSRNSLIFKLLGGQMSTEISFRLPGVRVEVLTMGERHHYVGMTAITPLAEDVSEINHVMYWSPRLMTLAKPVLVYFARNFLEQDRRIMDIQRIGKRHQPEGMLINDADTQAKWYFALEEGTDGVARGRPRIPQPGARDHPPMAELTRRRSIWRPDPGRRPGRCAGTLVSFRPEPERRRAGTRGVADVATPHGPRLSLRSAGVTKRDRRLPAKPAHASLVPGSPPASGVVCGTTVAPSFIPSRPKRSGEPGTSDRRNISGKQLVSSRPQPARRRAGTHGVAALVLALATGAAFPAAADPRLDRAIRALWVDSFKLGNLESDHELKGYRLTQVLKDRRARPMANVWRRTVEIGERTGFQDVHFFTEARGHRLYRVHRVLRRTPAARYRLYLKEARNALGPATVETVTTSRLERTALHIWTTAPNARAGARLEYRIVWRTKLKGDGARGTLVRTLVDGASWAREYRGAR